MYTHVKGVSSHRSDHSSNANHFRGRWATIKSYLVCIVALIAVVPAAGAATLRVQQKAGEPSSSVQLTGDGIAIGGKQASLHIVAGGIQRYRRCVAPEHLNERRTAFPDCPA